MNNQNYFNDRSGITNNNPENANIQNSNIPNSSNTNNSLQDAWPYIAATPPPNQPIFSPNQPFNEFKTNEFLTNDHFPQSQQQFPQAPPFYPIVPIRLLPVPSLGDS